MNIHSFFESLLSITYINSATHGSFYFVDYTSISSFTFVDTFLLTLDGREQLHFISIRYLEKIPRPIFAAKSPLSSSAKLINICYYILTLIHDRLKDLFSLLITLWIDAEK